MLQVCKLVLGSKKFDSDAQDERDAIRPVSPTGFWVADGIQLTEAPTKRMQVHMQFP
ncbi:MAG: hypothetical protein KDB03_16810 [Planctomycetales bacterium]|nr:hypothetical protein [Planctomycetales bacterium]